MLYINVITMIEEFLLRYMLVSDKMSQNSLGVCGRLFFSRIATVSVVYLWIW